MAKTEGLTPMMKQFFDLKEKHPEALLLFRCGDFYETYHDDAIEAARILGITLTKRNNGGSGDTTAMAGFPHHALDTYLPKLIRAGRRVAICDQLEDPKKTKTLVKRGITELVTPGVTMSDNVLSCKENNFLACVHFGKGSCGVSFLDISTGEFLVAEGTSDYIKNLFSTYQPKEIIYNNECRRQFLETFGAHNSDYGMDEWVYAEPTARQKLLSHFKVRSFKGFGIDHLKNAIIAAGVIIHYLEFTEHKNISHINTISRIEEEKYVRIDNFTFRSLELFGSINQGGTSLMDVIDHTITPMGGRMLRRWVTQPLISQSEINRRLDVVETLFKYPDLRYLIDEQLQHIGDMERISSKVAVGRVSPRDVVQLKHALYSLVEIKQACLNADNPRLQRLAESISLCEELRERIEKEMMPEPPFLLNKGNVIKGGFNKQLDELREISTGGREYLLKLQTKEQEKTGITSLKVGYNNVFGYYLEVRNTFKDKVPPEWIRKQTLAQAERYITQELKEYEEKILGADEKIQALEEKLFYELIVEINKFNTEIRRNAQIVSELDCLLSFASVARENKYIRPVIDESSVLDIKQGRHPVIETQLPIGESYVPNDVYLDTEKQQIIIITGPNMAGKSALLRQTALIVLLAQIGCFVPAEAARIGIVDRIFTRVGASDNISQGESTFMVEMTEAANILNNVSERSLVLFDELGRGTSTYDGISIAWAIVEYLHENKRAHARTLFATHYHELNEMEKNFSRIKNFNVSVKEVNQQVIFLRKLMPGGSEHSFGIHVAEIAGMPKSIVKRANTILKELEQDAGGADRVSKPISEVVGSREGMQLSFFQLDDPVLTQVRDEIIGLDINNLTPVEALNKLNEIKKILCVK